MAIEKDVEEMATADDGQAKPQIIQTGVVVKTEQKPGEDEEIILQRVVDNNEEYHVEVVVKKQQLSAEETIKQKIIDLKYKVAIGTADALDIETLQLLTA